MICFHKYSKWSEVLDTHVQWVKLQVKKCSKCGKVTKRYIVLFRISESGHTSASIINKALES